MSQVRNAECGARNGKREFLRLVSQRQWLVSFIVIVPFLLCTSAPVHAELIDRVVASINNDVITLSGLNQAVAFNVALGGRNGEQLRNETLEGLINRRLLLQEAYRLKFVEVSEQEVSAEIEKLKKRLGSEQAFSNFLAKLDTTPEELSRMLGERLLVERFVEKKIGLFVRVSRDEAQEYFTSHAAAFKGRQFPDVQKAITAGLYGQKLEQQTAQYLAELRGRADIRMNP